MAKALTSNVCTMIFLSSFAMAQRKGVKMYANLIFMLQTTLAAAAVHTLKEKITCCIVELGLGVGVGDGEETIAKGRVTQKRVLAKPQQQIHISRCCCC
jgi:hypothetical protein